MDKKFKNRIDAQDKEGKGAGDPWNFIAPEYDQRSAPYVNAGYDYGVGKAQKVGKSSTSEKYCMPTKAFQFKGYQAHED